MADTQWKANLDGRNPGTCAVGIIEALNPQFIKHGVEFVIQVGDLVDVEHDWLNGNPTVRTLPIREAAAQPLYEAGIGFFPLRGNHEASRTAAASSRASSRRPRASARTSRPPTSSAARSPGLTA